MQISDNFFQREQDRGKRRVERGGNRRCRSHGYQRFHFLRAQSQFAAQHGSDSRAHLHRRAFAAERNPAGERGGSAEEFSNHRAERDMPASRVEGGFRLWNPAPPGIGKKAIKQIAHDG